MLIGIILLKGGKRLFLAVANFIRFIDRTKNKSEQTKQVKFYQLKNRKLVKYFKIRNIQLDLDQLQFLK